MGFCSFVGFELFLWCSWFYRFFNVLLVWGNFRLTGFRSFKGFEGYKDFDGLRIFKEVIWGVMIGGVLGALKGALKGIKWFICFRDLRRRRAGKRWAEGDGRVRARAARGGWARAKARGGSEGGGAVAGGWCRGGLGGCGGACPQIQRL